MSPDPSTNSREDQEFGDWLHDQVSEACGFDSTSWVADTISRSHKLLKPVLGQWATLEVKAIWTQPVTAFTAPGRYIYVSRRIVERGGADESMALLIAHEVAHHALGHLEQFAGWAERIPRVGPAPLVAAAFRLAERHAYGPEQELDADRLAMEYCLKAGLDGHRCLHLFDVLQAEALDQGDIDGVFGTEDELDPETQGKWYVQAFTWARHRMRGYVPIAQRRAALLAQNKKSKRR